MKPDGLTLRQGYFNDPSAFQGLVDLLHDVFGIDIGAQEQLGGPDLTCMPFGYFDRFGRCIANFSVFAMPLMINGTIVTAAGYQSGAVRPGFRGRGLYRDLMQRAYAWAEQAGYRTGILLTDKPALYQPYGFRVVTHRKFGGPVPGFLPITNGNVRQLDLGKAADLALLRDMLACRQPVSNHFAVVSQAEMFLLNAHFDASITLSLLPSLKAVIAWKCANDGGVKLLDIVAQDIPPLSAILSHLNIQADSVETYFPPDRLSWEGQPVSYEGSCSLMMSGLGLEAAVGPLMLSPMADF
ncbi:GNAT family N-acetyltransferase [Agrobacterium vitis]|uniref:GNAT family N-acetyltransferase n=1 Tax=Agrobacterium vitis TaxID=373 RepID=A0ABD6GDW8_AGRVI|nr:GNAT family N-acetyltransferase [Agrobacterium vitis]MUO79849.1 GNAT family N-acetyltransferase [Agrobacterium vitis]MUO93662.1 GNAT family N-acetyltransferase [Agrobacterium vitis]MUP04087.1 GNAT family N-acetyltransferase [Agrobacterium vitis]MUZ83150.1 GNAT family N-acetyltransferase [Agrobacterium vitis]MVA11010.1 GNAT family N-acetyltransferase [Agrobacterium vitis]